MLAWRACKVRYDPYNGTGAMLEGGRWNSAGRLVIYASDSFAGCLLEILVHSARPRTLPGPHHAIRIEIPDRLVERLRPDALPAWYRRDSAEARAFGDRWLDEVRTAVLVVPALPGRSIGLTVLINPGHADAARIVRHSPFAVPWDERLF